MTTSPHRPPPLETATEPAHSAADLGQRWRALMGPLGFGERLLWFAFIGPDRRLIKALHEVPVGRHPTPRSLRNLFTALRELLSTTLDPDTTVALLLTGPGSGPVTDCDRRWAASLTEMATRFGVPLEPIFCANDELLVEVDPH